MDLERARVFAKRCVPKDPAMKSALVLLPIAAVPRIWTMISDQGVFWPDEIYQSIEQAHRLVFGYGMVPWEFRDGARSWVFPGLLAGAIKFATWFGARTGPDVVHAAKGMMVILAVWGVIATMKLANKIGGTNAAFIAGVWYALFPSIIVYGSRCMSEMASAPTLATAAWLAYEGGTKKNPRNELLAGAIAAFAIFLRYQNGVIGVGLFLMLLARRRWWDLLYFSVAALFVGMLGGWLDKLTWGNWFHSFFVYWKFNVVEGGGAKWGVADAMYYANTVWSATGWPIILIGLGFLLSLRRAAVLMLTVCVFVAAHVHTPHKEYRFMMPIVPLVLALGSAGLAWIIEKIPGNVRGTPTAGWVAALVGSITGAALAYKIATITFCDMGAFCDVEMGTHAPWHHEDGPNLAFWEAGQHNDLCGMGMSGMGLISSGGYSYLHKNVPIVSASDTNVANYITFPRLRPPPPGYRLVGFFDDYVLFKRDGQCAPAPYFRQMFP
ncbi:MAG: glycosyltransferase family 39 protein [Polyangiaceae bacterium]